MSKDTIFKTLGIFVCTAVLFSGCNQLDVNGVDWSKANETALSSETKADSYVPEGYYYHAGTELVLQPYDLFSDPNVHRIEENFEGSTHLGIKFFPKNERQQQYLSTLGAASISYIPFGFSPARLRLQEGLMKETLPLFPEISPYTIDTKNYRSTEPNSRPVPPIRLPIMYALWPKDIPIPSDIEHEILFEVSLPENNSETTIPTRAQGWNYGYTARFFTNDSLLGSFVPLINLKVSLTYDLYSGSEYTNVNGLVYLSPQIIGVSEENYDDYNVVVSLETNDWIISRDTTTTPIHKLIGTSGELWSSPINGGTSMQILSSVSTEYNIHRAVRHYFNAQHGLSSNISLEERGQKRKIHAMSGSAPGQYVAETKYDTTDPDYPQIFIYNDYNSQNDCIGSVLHELGHIRSFIHKGVNNFFSSSLAVEESYASFVGWYLGNNYYTANGFSFPSSSYQVNYQGRQSWAPGLGDYTPFFVDLYDDYNQYIDDSSALHDPISGVPANLLDYIGFTYNSIEDCGTYLYTFAGTYFTSEELTNYLSYYNGL